MGIFNYIGYLFGYILWFFFEICKNYGVAIILFSVVIKLIMFPFSIKQQKSMAQTARLSAKQKELQKKYGNDKQKLNEEIAKLYQSEGVNPMAGCATSILPLLMMLGVYYSVINPLQNTLHIAAAKVSSAISMLGTIPGVGNSFNAHYGEIEIIKMFPFIKDSLTMFSPQELQDIGEFSQGFNFLGLDLLGTPSASTFSSMLWLIPVLCFVSSFATTFVMQKMQGSQMQGQGCAKYMVYFTSVFTAWISYTVPAAVGFYWIISTVLGFVQALIMNHFYNVNHLNAKQEAARIALRLEEEALVKKLPEPRAVPEISKSTTKKTSTGKSTGKKKSAKNGGKSDYLGKKK